MTKADIERFITGKRAVFVRYVDHKNNIRDFICDEPKIAFRGTCCRLQASEGVDGIAIESVTGLKDVQIIGEWYEGK